MNALLGITHDLDIMSVLREQNTVTPQELDNFLTGVTPSPPLDPLRLFWDGIHNPWNDQLAETFAQAFINENPEFYSDQADRIKDHFFKRIETLRREITKHLPIFDDESPEEIASRVQARHLETLRASRARERKSTVS